MSVIHIQAPKDTILKLTIENENPNTKKTRAAERAKHDDGEECFEIIELATTESEGSSGRVSADKSATREPKVLTMWMSKFGTKYHSVPSCFHMTKSQAKNQVKQMMVRDDGSLNKDTLCQFCVTDETMLIYCKKR